MTIQIVRQARGAGDICRSVLAELPQWFGLADSNAEYARLAEEGPCWLAQGEDQTLGLMLLKAHGEGAVEIYLMAVRPAAHRLGVGRHLIDQAGSVAAAAGAPYLTVKTQGPSANYEPYARTRAFYRAMGFVALEEFPTLWDARNPCLFMVRPASGQRA